MDLGEKLRQARLDAGLSQRQLCGEEITRNMLSQIENGSAKPSMSTLAYLAGRLGKPISYFLGEEGAISANSSCMDAAWQAFRSGDSQHCSQLLEQYRSPDPVYDREKLLLDCLNTQLMAAHAKEAGKTVLARKLLQKTADAEKQLEWFPELGYRRAQLLAELSEPVPPELLPNLDGGLMLLASRALQEKHLTRAAALLDAAEGTSSPEWNLLRGKTAFAQEEYGTAARLLLLAEARWPEETIPMLEIAFRELGDYQMAYHYACKARSR